MHLLYNAHCELNYIEYYWAAAKRYTRENCNYSFVGLEPILSVLVWTLSVWGQFSDLRIEQDG